MFTACKLVTVYKALHQGTEGTEVNTRKKQILTLNIQKHSTGGGWGGKDNAKHAVVPNA